MNQVQCPTCGKHTRRYGFLAGWHLCLTEKEVERHGTYAAARAKGRLREWAYALMTEPFSEKY